MPRRRLSSSIAVLTIVATSAASPAWSQATTDVAGVKYPQSASVGGSPLQLNGAGVRWRFIVRVYTAGLYLATKGSSTEAVLAAPGPKRLHVVMLREIDATELGKLFTRGMKDNSPREEFSKSIPGTLRMADLFSAKKRLAVGESFGVDWVPGQGTLVRINGLVQGEPIKEPEFFNALMRIWLGPSPADAQLKDALLGVPRQASGNPNQQ
jgi:hypothetical protein